MLKEELTKVQTQLLFQQEEAKIPQQTFMSNTTSENYNTTNLMPAAMNSNPFAAQGTIPKLSQNANSPGKQQKPANRLEELKEMRENLLSAGLYNESDDMIIELDGQIARLGK